MYFHLMCTLTAFPSMHRCTDAEEFTQRLLQRKVRIANAANPAMLGVQAIVREAHDEIIVKVFRLTKERPAEIGFFTVPGENSKSVHICAVAKVKSKDCIFLFSSSFGYMEPFIRLDFPLMVW